MFDLHVHTAPDVVPRLLDDTDTVTAYEEAGFSGCVLKGHHDPTAARAAIAGAGRRLAVYGGVTLNQAVGGLNPAAVAAALQLGGRVVWLPTQDARAHAERHLPRWCPSGGGGGGGGGPSPRLALPPLDPSVGPAVEQILALVAGADAVLATGHVSGAELGWLLPAARRAGVRRVLLTHPSWLVPGLAASDVRALCEVGALAEVTAYQLLHQHGGDARPLAAFIKEVGVERCVLSSDAGQPGTPAAPEALARLVDALAAEGLDRNALTAMAGDVPETLVRP